MEKNTIEVHISMKKWAMPIVFMIVFFGFKSPRWCFNISIDKKFNA